MNINDFEHISKITSLKCLSALSKDPVLLTQYPSCNVLPIKGKGAGPKMSYLERNFSILLPGG